MKKFFVISFIMLLICTTSCKKVVDTFAYIISGRTIDRPTEAVIDSVRIKSYTASVEECGKSDSITASNKKAKDGFVACNFLKFGTKLRIPTKFGNRIFVVEDRLHDSKRNHVDIYVKTKDEAFQIGTSLHSIVVIN